MLRRETPKTRSNSAEKVGGNDDLLLQILLYLPIKSLLKFKSVSKHFLSLISNPHFSHSRTITSQRNPSGLFLQNPSNHPINNKFTTTFIDLTLETPSHPSFKSLSFDTKNSGIEILQSCNGLFLIASHDVNGLEINYYVYNPTTRHYTKLPKLQVINGSGNWIVYGASLAFEPSKSPHYKVICVGNSDPLSEIYQVAIYSSQSGPWRVCETSLTAPFAPQFHRGVYWNGAIHWVCNFGKFLYFDVYGERMGEIPLSQIPDEMDDRTVEFLGECGGHLHVIEIENPAIQFNVYEMEQDRSGWFVKYYIDLHEVTTKFPEIIEMIGDYSGTSDLYYFGFSVLGLVRAEIDEESYLVLQIPGKVIRCKINGAFETQCDFVVMGGDGDSDTSALRLTWTDAFQYIESLACV